MIFSSIQKKNELKRFYPKSYNEIDTLAVINGTVAFMRQSCFLWDFSPMPEGSGLFLSNITNRKQARLK